MTPPGKGTETAENHGPGDVLRVQRDAEYERRLRAEEEYFDHLDFSTLDIESPAVGAYLNEQFTGDARTPWYDAIPRYGVFRRGCLLGVGGSRLTAALLERNPLLSLTVYDISGESLVRAERETVARFPGRLTTEQSDLNFVELPEGAYDIVVSTSCLHHLVNLEHVAYQINRALSSDGYVFLNDYVGEAAFQFVPEKRRLFEALLEEAQRRYPALSAWRPVWPDGTGSRFSPFEAVRSDEILDVLRSYLDEVTVRTAGPLLALAMMLQRAAPDQSRQAEAPSPRRRLASLIRGRRSRQGGDLAELARTFGTVAIPFDRLLSRAGVFRPGSAFAVYRKRT